MTLYPATILNTDSKQKEKKDNPFCIHFVYYPGAINCFLVKGFLKESRAYIEKSFPIHYYSRIVYFAGNRPWMPRNWTFKSVGSYTKNFKVFELSRNDPLNPFRKPDKRNSKRKCFMFRFTDMKNGKVYKMFFRRFPHTFPVELSDKIIEAHNGNKKNPLIEETVVSTSGLRR